MRGDDARRLLAAWPAATTEALGPALDEAAEAMAAEVRRNLHGLGSPDGTPLDPAAVVTTGRDGAGCATVTVAVPGAVALEYGTWRRTARPVLRPAAAALHANIRRRIADALRHALRSAR